MLSLRRLRSRADFGGLAEHDARRAGLLGGAFDRLLDELGVERLAGDGEAAEGALVQ